MYGRNAEEIEIGDDLARRLGATQVPHLADPAGRTAPARSWRTVDAILANLRR